MMVWDGSYRAPLSYSDEIVDAAERGLDRLRSALKAAPADAPGASADTGRRWTSRLRRPSKTFMDAMDDDFNPPAGWQRSSS